MKIHLTLVFLFLTFLIKAQAPVVKPSVYVFNKENISFTSSMTDYKDYFADVAFYDLQVYNPSIGLLDNYSFVSENMYDIKDKMSLIYSSHYLINYNSNTILSPINQRHIDSFNPYGATNLGEAFALGLINTIFKKN